MFEVSSVSFPPLGIASRAFRARFISTCSICPGSAFTVPKSTAGTVSTSMSSPISRRNMVSRFSMTLLRSISRGEQLAGNAGGPIGGRFDLARPFSQPAAGWQAIHQQLRVAQDDGQEIVEIVGDAPGQAANRFHL